MSTTEDLRFPPGPPLPQAVQGAIFIGAQRQGLRLLRKRYGDAFTMSVPGFGKCVVISSPELIKQTYTAKPDVLHTGERNPLSYVLGPGSMFSLDEDEHLRERRLLLPPFHGERMQSYEAIIEEEALREMDSWPEGEEFETLEPMMRITLNAILRAVFGAEGAEFDALRKLLPGMVDLGQRLALIPLLRKDAGRFSPWVRFKRMRAAFDVQVESLIDRALADPDLEERADVLALLLRAKYEDDGSAMTRSAIADQLLTLLVAGHETTAGQLAWAIERLRRHPGVLRRLVEEVDADSGNAYRQATILEVQRTRPVITGHGRRRGQALRSRRVADPAAHHDPRRRDRRARRRPVLRRRRPLRPGALRRQEARHVQVGALRRRDAPVHRRGLREHGDGHRAAHAAAPLRPRHDVRAGGALALARRRVRPRPWRARRRAPPRGRAGADRSGRHRPRGGGGGVSGTGVATHDGKTA